MRNFLLKCDKWYNVTMSLFSNGKKVGSFLPGFYSSAYRVIIGDKEYTIRKKSTFSNNLSIYSHSQLLAEVQNFSFKNQSVITTYDRAKYIIKSNTWNNRYQLLGPGGLLGEVNRHSISTYFSFDDNVDDLLVAAVIVQTYTNYETAILVACFVPIFVILIT